MDHNSCNNSPVLEILMPCTILKYSKDGDYTNTCYSINSDVKLNSFLIKLQDINSNNNYNRYLRYIYTSKIYGLFQLNFEPITTTDKHELDRQHVVSIHYNKNDYFTWTLSRIVNPRTNEYPKAERDIGLLILCKGSSSINTDLIALNQIIVAYYTELTRLKFREALLPRPEKYIKYKDKIYQVRSVEPSNKSKRYEKIPIELLPIYELTITTKEHLLIKNSVDWNVCQHYLYVNGEVICSKCNRIDSRISLDAKHIYGNGVLCGPCRDELYNENLITDNMFD